ncbi:ATP-binding cassette (ABC) Superfamily [Phytophthora palmivora]|uniref:ATP-binding cassette (ABC) Superfamily n=1 Tax=Phytophthora palmivora TaxID=4796 RepID=A0A2P4Y2D7_9STRA|nr:ATP-binding cassette (ABC) Superfamily [Phytophthora palmivora]
MRVLLLLKKEARSPLLSYFTAFHRKGIAIPIRLLRQGRRGEGCRRQERYQDAQLECAAAPTSPVYPRGYYPPDARSGSPMFLEHLKTPRGLNHGCTSRGAYAHALVQDEPRFVNDIEATRNPRFFGRNQKTVVGCSPSGGYAWVQPENTTTKAQAEDLFWRWVSLKNFTAQNLKELR